MNGMQPPPGMVPQVALMPVNPAIPAGPHGIAEPGVPVPQMYPPPQLRAVDENSQQ